MKIYIFNGERLVKKSVNASLVPKIQENLLKKTIREFIFLMKILNKQTISRLSSSERLNKSFSIIFQKIDLENLSENVSWITNTNQIILRHNLAV